MEPVITAFANSPDRGRGLARDMRVRWALEEVDQPYKVRLVTFDEMREPSHVALQPFGQIPTYEEGDLVLFESGSIVLHIAENHSGLLPTEEHARARTIAWMFAAVNTVEPPILERDSVKYHDHGKAWQAERLALVDARIERILNQLIAFMKKSDWLVGAFSAADILMVHVLCRLEGTAVLDRFPTLTAYMSRAKARPAYQRAFAAQLLVFTDGNL